MSKNKRVKPEVNMQKMKDLNDVNLAMRRIRDLKAKMTKMDIEAQEKINKVRAEVEAKAKPMLQEIEPLQNGILAFAEYNKNELFKTKKTIDLNFGQIGFRKSTKISIKNSTLGLLQHFHFTKAINIKKSVDKEALSKWTDTKLDKVNAKRITEDSFWYEVKEEEVTKNIKNEKK